MMIRYNICLVKKGNQILLINREKPSWMGCWNGIGGKLEPGESPHDSMIRELAEETAIEEHHLQQLQFKGYITWSVDGAGYGGGYLYLAEVSESYRLDTPVKTAEGILDWKNIDWILHEENQGLASNIPKCLEMMLHHSQCYEHHCVYVGGVLQDQMITTVPAETESNPVLRAAYFDKYSGKSLESVTTSIGTK